MSELDKILEQMSGGAKIVSEEHNLANIVPAGPAGDSNEFAPTKERAVARASLDTTTGRVALMSAGVLPWHGLGVIVDRATTAQETILLASLDWKVIKVAMEYEWRGQRRPSPQTFALVREDTGRQLGTVGSRYQPIQNVDAFAFLDGVLAEHGARYETAGSLYGGEKVFMCAHFPRQAFAVNGDDQVEPFVALCSPHDGSGCAVAFPTGVRIVCANTYRTAGSNRSGKGLKIRHTGSIKAKIAAAQQALGMAVKSFDQFREAAEVMTTKKVEIRHFANGVLDAVLDVTAAEAAKGFDPLGAAMLATQAAALVPGALDLARKSFEAKVERRGELLEEIIAAYETEKNGRNSMRGTAWAAFNAVTDAADHSKLGRKVGTADEQRSRRFENVLAGQADDMKQAAFQLATA
jgi:phage/plasmid-like protein (TIGR03299 family)